MKRLLAIAFATCLVGPVGGLAAQPAGTAADLVSSWTLVGVEKGVAGDEPTRLRGARGLLVLDGAGYAFEFFSTASRELPEAPQLDPQRAFADYGGFWGRYAADAAAGRIDFEAWDGVSPSVRDLEFSRSYALDGDRLIVTSANEPQAQGDTRWTWQRMPTVENLSPYYRQVVGFWQHIEERQVNEATGEIRNARQRAPSVIVYTPGGFVGVHFPPRERGRFAGDEPALEEAQAALRGYIGYFGTLGVYPGEVAHNILAGISPATGSILRRGAEITGDELVVRLAPLTPRTGEGARFVTTVTLHRLSGAEDMLPR